MIFTIIKKPSIATNPAQADMAPIAVGVSFDESTTRYAIAMMPRMIHSQLVLPTMRLTRLVLSFICRIEAICDMASVAASVVAFVVIWRLFFIF